MPLLHVDWALLMYLPLPSPQSPPPPVTVPPEIEACSTVIRGSDGSNFSSLCSNTSSPDPMYTNIVPYELEGVWDAVFLGPSAPRPEPAYFAGFSVGVAVSEIQATLYRAASKPQFPILLKTNGSIHTIAANTAWSFVLLHL